MKESRRAASIRAWFTISGAKEEIKQTNTKQSLENSNSLWFCLHARYQDLDPYILFAAFIKSFYEFYTIHLYFNIHFVFCPMQRSFPFIISRYSLRKVQITILRPFRDK